MASQTDRKEEFRKYLDKGNVLSVLTTVLTDLFEMDPKPEDPALYLYEKIGEAINKDKTNSAPNHTEAAQKDIEMKDTSQTAQPTTPAEADSSTNAPKQSTQENTEPKPAPPEQTKSPSQQPIPSDPAAAAPASGGAPATPLSVPATTQ